MRREALDRDLAESFSIEIDGRPVNAAWTWETVSEKKDGASGSRHAVVELSHRTQPVKLKIHTMLDGTPFLTRWIEITNTSDKPLPLSGIYPFTGLLWEVDPPTAHRTSDPREPVLSVFTLGRFMHNRWEEEGDFQWEPFTGGRLTWNSGIHGRSGWSHPFFIVRNESSGEYFMGALAWSGNWVAELSGGEDAGLGTARLSFKAGPYSPDPAMRVLAPQETVSSPAMHLGAIHGDLDTCVQSMHEHIRRSVLRPRIKGREQLVQDNHWGYLSGRESEKGDKEAIDIAAEHGIELFIIDAGWYGDKLDNWANNVGDWFAGPWLPNGLEPVREYARKKGLLFGLWMEPESFGVGSQLRKQHPDWSVTRDSQPVSGGRNLDLTKPEVARWVESEISRVIGRYDLDLFRLDYNTSAGPGGNAMRDGYLENTSWRYYEVLYGILERLRQKFPNVIFENCAGGGGRTDLGILQFFNTTWISDWQRTPHNVKMLNGMSVVLPPEILNRAFGPQSDDLRYGDLDFQMRVPLFGHPTGMGFAHSEEEINLPARDRIRHHLNLYKKFLRPILTTARVYHHTPVLPFARAGDWCVLEYASPDKSRAYVGLFRLSGEGSNEYLFRPRGLSLDKRYKVTFDNSGVGVEMGGLDLVQDGLLIRLAGVVTSELILFEELSGGKH